MTICALERRGRHQAQEFAETNHSNVVLMDVDSLYRQGGKGKKGKG